MPPDRTPFEQAAVRYCAPRGIRLSEFLEVWSEGDQAAAIEWQLDEDARCPDCGLDIRETFGAANEDKWNAELSGHCDGCRAKERARSVMTGDDNLDRYAGARLRFYRDKETDGDVGDTSPNGREARTASP